MASLSRLFQSNPNAPKLSLRVVFVVPFLVQIFASVGLTGWLSFRNGSNDDGTIEFDIVDQRTAGKFEKWLTNNQGDRSQLLSVRKNYDPRVRPWYEAGVKAGKPVWSEIYAYFGSRVLLK